MWTEEEVFCICRRSPSNTTGYVVSTGGISTGMPATLTAHTRLTSLALLLLQVTLSAVRQ
mgnify:CR=1 FL=1